jgi:hypothetical protein
VERFLTADADRIFRLWLGERDYKKHLALATVECAQGGMRSILDYVRREGLEGRVSRCRANFAICENER